jgi:hypothetical protein
MIVINLNKQYFIHIYYKKIKLSDMVYETKKKILQGAL